MAKWPFLLFGLASFTMPLLAHQIMPTLPQPCSLQEIHRCPQDVLDAVIWVKQPGKGFGSGYIITSDGYIVTNEHVSKLFGGIGSSFYVEASNGKSYTGHFIKIDESRDIALGKLDTNETLPYLNLDHGSLQPRDHVTLIGWSKMHQSERDVSYLGWNNWAKWHCEYTPGVRAGDSGGVLVGPNMKIVGMPSAVNMQDGHTLAVSVQDLRDFLNWEQSNNSK